MSGESRAVVADAWTLTRVEVLTFLRYLRSDTRQLTGSVAGVGMFLLVAAAQYPAVTAYGRALAAGRVPLGQSGALSWYVFGFAAYVGFAGGFNQSRVGAVGPLIQTSIPPTAVAVGRFCTRTLQALSFVGPVTVLLVAMVGVGAGGPVVPAVVLFAFGLLFATGLVVGRFLGDVARYLNDRLQISLWLKASAVVVLMTAVFAVVQALLGTQVETDVGFSVGSDGALVPGVPLQAYASVAFAPFGTRAQPLGAAVAMLLVGGLASGFRAAVSLETTIITSDLGSDSGAGARAEESVAVPRVFDVSPSARLAWRYLLRTRRDPRTLAHLSPLLLGVLSMGVSVANDPSILTTAGPPAVVIGGSVLAGAAYCLNPLGDERAQLPLLLTSTESVGVLLRARMLAGLVLGLAVGLGIGTPLALVEYSPAFVLGQGVLAVVLAVATTGVAVGLGALVPKFEQREYMSVKRAHPSTTVLLGLFAAGIVVGGVGFVLLVGTVTAPSASLGLAWLVYVAVLGLAGAGGYRYAVGRVTSFRLDEL